MKKIIPIALILLLGISVSVCVVGDELPEEKPTAVSYSNTLATPPIPTELTFAGETVPVDVYWVRENLEKEVITQCYLHSRTLLIFKRSGRYFPTIEKILAEEGVPDDLKYLCLAESGLENVTSPAGAAGFWQFQQIILQFHFHEGALLPLKQNPNRVQSVRLPPLMCSSSF